MADADIADAPVIIWQPNSGPQTALLSCPVFEVFYGGARGGGKTDGMLAEFIRHAADHGEGAIGLMVRRTLVDIQDTIERSKAIYGKLGWTYQDQQKVWRSPDGARLRFAYLERDADADHYQGHSYTRVYVEEIGQFPSAVPVLKLMATLRSGSGVPCGFRATGNPGGPGHHWVRARYIDPAPHGWTIIRDDQSGLERIFIPSKVADNPKVGKDYVNRLRASGSKELVRAWLEGDWSVIQGAFFDCWSNEKHVIRPFTIPDHWIRFRSADWGSYRPFSIGWWAVVGDDYQHGVGGPILPRGALVRYREWYGASAPNVGVKLPAEEVGREIVKRDGGETIDYAVLDPAAFASDGGPSIAERLASGTDGKAWFKRADNKRVGLRGALGGWDQLRARLIGEPDGRPMIYCFSTCVDSIRTIPALQHDPDKPEDVDTEGEDHAGDEWRYACMSRPYIQGLEPKTDWKADLMRRPTLDEMLGELERDDD